VADATLLHFLTSSGAEVSHTASKSPCSKACRRSLIAREIIARRFFRCGRGGFECGGRRGNPSASNCDPAVFSPRTLCAASSLQRINRQPGRSRRHPGDAGVNTVRSLAIELPSAGDLLGLQILAQTRILARRRQRSGSTIDRRHLTFVASLRSLLIWVQRTAPAPASAASSRNHSQPLAYQGVFSSTGGGTG